MNILKSLVEDLDLKSSQVSGLFQPEFWRIPTRECKNRPSSSTLTRRPKHMEGPQEDLASHGYVGYEVPPISVRPCLTEKKEYCLLFSSQDAFNNKAREGNTTKNDRKSKTMWSQSKEWWNYLNAIAIEGAGAGHPPFIVKTWTTPARASFLYIRWWQSSMRMKVKSFQHPPQNEQIFICF